jgi:hypothetical protein
MLLRKVGFGGIIPSFKTFLRCFSIALRADGTLGTPRLGGRATLSRSNASIAALLTDAVHAHADRRRYWLALRWSCHDVARFIAAVRAKGGVGHREPKSGAAAARLGGEERLEGALHDVR